MTKLICTASLLQGTINFQELSLKQYRQLLKCFLGDEVDINFILLNTNTLLKKLTCLSEKEINQLNFLDYFLLLLNIRQVSIGDLISLYVLDNEQKQVKADLLVHKIINQINNSELLNLLKTEVTEIGEIYYKLPTIAEIIFLEKNINTSPYIVFLQKIKFSNTIINLEDFSYNEKELILEKMPVKIITCLTKRAQMIINYFNKFNLLESINNNNFDKALPYTLNSDIIGFVIKLVFNTSLEGIYDCMFALTKAANFSCTFLDNCSPGEFYLFVKKLEQINAQQQTTNEQNFSIKDGFPDDLPPITSEANFGME